MTADLELSPEAVERLAKALEAQEQADMHGTMVKVSRQACDEGAATIRALTAENDRLRAERDEQRERAEEAESEITRAQEQVSAEFEGDCWKTLRNLLDRTGFDWSEHSEDGVTASDAQEWIVEELDRLEAERDAAWQAGTEAMREAAIMAVNSTVAPIVGTPYSAGGRAFADAIRALPLPGQPTNNEENT